MTDQQKKIEIAMGGVPEMGLFIFGTIIVGILAIAVIYMASSPGVEDTPHAQLTRLRDECVRRYGAGNKAADCWMELLANEQKKDEMNRITQRAR